MGIDNLRFTKEHEWVALDDATGVVTIGITDFAAGELGDIVFVELPDIGREAKAEDVLGAIEAVKTVADLFAPISGAVLEINDQLESDPALVNRSPYDDGWFLKMQMADRSELDALMTRDEYHKMIGRD